jgi:hypothetical protein
MTFRRRKEADKANRQRDRDKEEIKRRVFRVEAEVRELKARVNIVERKRGRGVTT